MKLSRGVVSDDPHIAEVHEAVAAEAVVLRRSRVPARALVPRHARAGDVENGHIEAPCRIGGREVEYVEEVPFLLVCKANRVTYDRVRGDSVLDAMRGHPFPRIAVLHGYDVLALLIASKPDEVRAGACDRMHRGATDLRSYSRQACIGKVGAALVDPHLGGALPDHPCLAVVLVHRDEVVRRRILERIKRGRPHDRVGHRAVRLELPGAALVDEQPSLVEDDPRGIEWESGVGNLPEGGDSQGYRIASRAPCGRCGHGERGGVEVDGRKRSPRGDIAGRVRQRADGRDDEARREGSRKRQYVGQVGRAGGEDERPCPCKAVVIGIEPIHEYRITAVLA